MQCILMKLLQNRYIFMGDEEIEMDFLNKKSEMKSNLFLLKKLKFCSKFGNKISPYFLVSKGT